MKTILVPTDFSLNATAALDYAAALARKEKARMVILHAVHLSYELPEMHGEPIPADAGRNKKDASKRLAMMCSGIRSKFGVDCTSVTKAGFAQDIIIESIREIHPDLVIMGTKGESGFKSQILGSNASNIMDKATCPVLVVPEKAEINRTGRILYATDYLASDVESLAQLVVIAKALKASIEVLHISDRDYSEEAENYFMEEFEQRVRKKIVYKKLNFHLLTGKSFEKELENYVKEAQPEILAMSAQHRGLFDKLFRKSHTQYAAYHTNIPLLVFHHKKEAVIFF